MSAFWSVFVVVITVASLIGCLWLLFTQSRGKTGAETTHTWDDDLTEYNNPLPRWWLWLFILTVVFSAGYLAFYPGLGNFMGSSAWTSQKEMAANLARITERRTAQFARLADKPVTELAHDPAALALGRSAFLGNCAGCHGTDAQGAIGFPNLADRDWLYGGEPETILASIERGRSGQMPPFLSALSAQDAQALLDFVPYWSDAELATHRREAGMAVFSRLCAACHGPEGKGNVALGAPDMTDDTWLWGGRKEQIRETILFGRKNFMPAHAALMSKDETRMAAAYVYSLTSGAPGMAVPATQKVARQ
ncbi:MAG TPA: cytochrome-c oxidase, cbb3-type subunit III [Nevskiaceae bacterium]|nr:cytochrome-c oxidase, cbb3-type subunit III [Nevskiaceae bacterium]